MTEEYYEKLLESYRAMIRFLNLKSRFAELRYNPYHDPKNGKFTYSKEKSLKGVDKSQKSGIMKSSAEISAVGENKFEKGFSKHNLDEHWGGTHDHSAEYPDFTKEEYAERALQLIQSAADGKNILGYKNEIGQIARYDVKTNDYVKGHPNIGIATMFKPTDGKAYYIRHSRESKE